MIGMLKNFLLKHWFKCAFALIVVLLGKLEIGGGIIFIGALSNFGEAFAKNTLRKFYMSAITPVIANTDYEGEIKAIGDRVNILMFLDDITLSDYAVGTDMTTQHPTDTEASLVIDQKKYYNFDIDSVDKQFTYVDDEDSVLIENAAKILEKAVDQRLLRTYIEEVKAGNRVPNGASMVGTWNFVVGNTGTYVTITTTATVGTATLTGATSGKPEFDYFPVDILNRGFRIMSTQTNSPWYKITARTSSTVITFNNWDNSVTGSNLVVGGLQGIAGDIDGAEQFDGAGAGYGCQIEGMKATQATTTNIYALVVDLAKKLDENDIPQDNRHLSVPPWFYNTLVRASQVQPAIAIAYEDVLKNKRVARVSGFDVHMVSNDRFSTDVEPAYPSGAADSGTISYKILANHIGFITFAHKWNESRVIDAQLQFAKLYQGLNLYGFKVLNMRRKAGAYLYCYE